MLHIKYAYKIEYYFKVLFVCANMPEKFVKIDLLATEKFNFKTKLPNREK